MRLLWSAARWHNSQATQDDRVVWEVNIFRGKNGNVRIVSVVLLEVEQECENPAFSNAKVFVCSRVSGPIFSNHKDVEGFRQARKTGTEWANVLRECDDVATCFVLATLANPHYEARRCEAAKHFLHLSHTIDNVMKLWKNFARVGVVLAVVAMHVLLGN